MTEEQQSPNLNEDETFPSFAETTAQLAALSALVAEQLGNYAEATAQYQQALAVAHWSRIERGLLHRNLAWCGQGVTGVSEAEAKHWWDRAEAELRNTDHWSFD